MQVGRVYAGSGVVQQRLESHLNSLSRVQQSSAVNRQGDFGVDLLCGRLRLHNRDGYNSPEAQACQLAEMQSHNLRRRHRRLRYAVIRSGRDLRTAM